MPTKTIAEQRRESKGGIDSSIYEITTTVQDTGELPDRGGFVMEIIDVDDPSLDQFVRVCTVGDMETWSLDRPTAVANSDPYFRTPTLELTYTALTKAQTASSFLIEKLNELVNQYRSYDADFKAVPLEVIELPQTDLAEIANLIEDFESTVEDKKEIEETISQKEQECSGIDADLQEKKSVAANLDTAIKALQDQESVLSRITSSLDQAKVALNKAVTEADKVDSLWSVYGPDIQSETVDNVEYNAMDGSLNSTTGTLMQARDATLRPAAADAVAVSSQAVRSLTELLGTIATLEAQKDRLEREIEQLESESLSCAQELQKLKKTQQELARQEQELLGKIKNVCPSYTRP